MLDQLTVAGLRALAYRFNQMTDVRNAGKMLRSELQPVLERRMRRDKLFRGRVGNIIEEFRRDSPHYLLKGHKRKPAPRDLTKLL